MARINSWRTHTEVYEEHAAAVSEQPHTIGGLMYDWFMFWLETFRFWWLNIVGIFATIEILRRVILPLLGWMVIVPILSPFIGVPRARGWLHRFRGRPKPLKRDAHIEILHTETMSSL